MSKSSTKDSASASSSSSSDKGSSSKSKDKDSKDKDKDKEKKGGRGRSKSRERKDDEPKVYCLKVSSSGRAKCRKCKKFINKDDVRAGVKHSQEDAVAFEWYHIRCLDDLLKEDPTAITGFNDLDSPQKKIVQDIVAKRKRRAKLLAEGKDAEDEPDFNEWTVVQLQAEIEKRKMWIDKERPRKDDYVAALEKDDAAGGGGVSMKNLSPPQPKETKKKSKRGRSPSRSKKKTKRSKDDSGDEKDMSGSDRDDDDKRSKSKGRRSSKDGSKGKLPDQIKINENRKELGKLKMNELKEMLQTNGQKVSGTKKDLIERVADGKVYGALPRCPQCGGAVLKVKYKNKYGHSGQGEWSCPGYYDDKTFKHCKYSSENETREPWKD